MANDTRTYKLELTALERDLLMEFVDGTMRDAQGDGERSDEADDALVSLNDKLEKSLALRT